MKDESPDSRTTQERFTALGKHLLTTPKADVAKLEKKWQRRKVKRKRA